MLPYRRSGFAVGFACAGLVTTALLAGCAESLSPEARVQKLVAAGEQAAEARDVSGLMELVSASFLDERGAGRDELQQTLRGYFVMHQSVHLLTRIDSIAFPYQDYARVQLTVGSLGREAAAATAFDLAADVRSVDLELQLEDGEWKVVRAVWRSAPDR